MIGRVGYFKEQLDIYTEQLAEQVTNHFTEYVQQTDQVRIIYIMTDSIAFNSIYYNSVSTD